MATDYRRKREALERYLACADKFDGSVQSLHDAVVEFSVEVESSYGEIVNLVAELGSEIDILGMVARGERIVAAVDALKGGSNALDEDVDAAPVHVAEQEIPVVEPKVEKKDSSPTQATLRAETWVREFLADGAWHLGNEVVEAAKEQGISSYAFTEAVKRIPNYDRQRFEYQGPQWIRLVQPGREGETPEALVKEEPVEPVKYERVVVKFDDPITAPSPPPLDTSRAGSPFINDSTVARVMDALPGTTHDIASKAGLNASGVSQVLRFLKNEKRIKAAAKWNGPGQKKATFYEKV